MPCGIESQRSRVAGHVSRLLGCLQCPFLFSCITRPPLPHHGTCLTRFKFVCSNCDHDRISRFSRRFFLCFDKSFLCTVGLLKRCQAVDSAVRLRNILAPCSTIQVLVSGRSDSVDVFTPPVPCTRCFPGWPPTRPVDFCVFSNSALDRRRREAVVAAPMLASA